MEILNKVDYGYLLQRGLSDLHQESIDWLSENLFLETEFSYFKKVLNRYTTPTQSKQSELMIHKLNQQLSILQQDVIEDFGMELKSHEIYLSKLLDVKPGHDDITYRDRHQLVASQHTELGLRLRSFKKELMDFVVEVK